MIKFIVRRVLPWIAANLDLDIDTVEKSDGFYFRVRVEILGYTIVDHAVKFSSQQTKDIKAGEVLTLDGPLDIRKNKLGGNPFE